MNRKRSTHGRRPCEELAPFVEYFYHYEQDATEHTGVDRPGMDVLPGTHLRMGILLDAPTVMDSRAGRSTNPAIGFAGYFTGPVRYTPTGGLRLLLIGFTPIGLQQFIDYPVSDLTDRNVSLKDVFPKDYERVYDTLFAAQSISTKMSVIEEFLLEKLHSRHLDGRVAAVTSDILAQGGTLNVRELADRYAMTERTLQRRFRNAVGISPKRFCRLARFQKACGMLNGAGEDRLGPIAYDLGYFDQAHFIHDVRRLSGRTPRELASLRRTEMALDFEGLKCSHDLIFV